MIGRVDDGDFAQPRGARQLDQAIDGVVRPVLRSAQRPRQDDAAFYLHGGAAFGARRERLIDELGFDQLRIPAEVGDDGVGCGHRCDLRSIASYRAEVRSSCWSEVSWSQALGAAAGNVV